MGMNLLICNWVVNSVHIVSQFITENQGILTEAWSSVTLPLG
jgi:hypothetical protein